MAQQDRQAVLPDGWRAVQSLGSTRKIPGRWLWVARALVPVTFLYVLAAGAPELERTVPGVAGALIAAALLSYAVYTVVVRWFSTAAPELPLDRPLDDTTELPDVGDAEARQLKSAGYGSVAAVALADSHEFARESPFSPERAEWIQRAARERFESPAAARARLRGDSWK